MREYIWLDDMPLAVVADVDTPSPKLWFVHPDHIDRPVKMTDGTQAVVWDAIYRPFGAVHSITGSASNNLRFPGQYFLIENGLHYNWHRHYDPTTGRYLQADPVSTDISNSRSNSIARSIITLTPQLPGPNGLGSVGSVSNEKGLPTLAAIEERTTIRSDSALGRPVLEPLAFVDGPSLYAYARSRPATNVDAKGLLTGPFTPIPNSGGAQLCAVNSSKHDRCVARCLHLLPSPSGDLQSSEYRKCYRECMGRL